MKETMKDYLTEIENRQKKEDEEEIAKAAAAE